MPDFKPGKYKIRSALEGALTSVYGVTIPGVSQVVRVNLDISTWRITPQLGEPEAFLLNLGHYRKTGQRDDKVIVSDEEEVRVVAWRIALRREDKYYTIEPLGDLGKGWTVVPDPGGEPGQQAIEIRELDLRPGAPPQLFFFEDAHGE